MTTALTETLAGPVLVLLDHAPDGTLRAAVRELVTIARDLGAVEGVWVDDAGTGAPVGPGTVVLHELGELGLGVVVAVDLAGADPRLTGVVGDALAAVAAGRHAAAVLVTSSFENKEIAATIGVRAGAGVVVDASGVVVQEGRLVVDKTVLAGTWTTRCAVTTPLAVVAVKANAAQPTPAEVATSPEVEVLAVPSGPAAVTVVEQTPRPASARPALGEAQVVVVGGRGTQGDFSAVEELADVLGGAVGATRVATDEGWIDHEAQIGQTGVTVAPRLYIGAGVSGAVHHRGGMQSSGTIVAVNSDPESPIFEIADLGIVGDLFSVLPQASAELRRLRG